jgi:hypothetical protein
VADVADSWAVTFTTGVAATYSLVSGPRIGVATGPRAEVGVFAVHGTGANARATTMLGVASAWEIELHVRLGGVAAMATVEGGVYARGADVLADRRGVLYLYGPFVGGSLGVLF